MESGLNGFKTTVSETLRPRPTCSAYARSRRTKPANPSLLRRQDHKGADFGARHEFTDTSVSKTETISDSMQQAHSDGVSIGNLVREITQNNSSPAEILERRKQSRNVTNGSVFSEN